MYIYFPLPNLKKRDFNHRLCTIHSHQNIYLPSTKSQARPPFPFPPLIPLSTHLITPVPTSNPAS